MASPMSDLVPSQRVSPPTTPDDVYPTLPKALQHVNFDLASSLKDKDTEEHPPHHLQARKEALSKTLSYLKTQQAHFMGYQVNQKMDFEGLGSFLDVHINNIGDPFVEGNCTTNTKFMERAVLDYYASLWNANWPHKSHLLGDKEGNSYWGFLLTMGSTEGNMYALWNARDYLGGKILLMESEDQIRARLVYRQAPVPQDAVPPPPATTKSASSTPFPPSSSDFCDNYFSPVAFYSEDTHYSFAKATRLIGIPTFAVVGEEKYKGMCPITNDGKWPDEVPSHSEGSLDGTINIESLAKVVLFFAQRGHPIFVSLNYGSTFKGAYDSVVKTMEKLMPIFKFYGHDQRTIDVGGGKKSTRTGFWIHVDGALGASYMPYLKMAAHRGCKFEDGCVLEVAPEFDFSLEAVHSISLSGHKWMGAPLPCGLFMSKRKYQISPPSNPTYTGTPDTTFAGSRNGLSAIFFWSHLSQHTLKQQIDKAVYCQEMARYIFKTMTELGKKLKLDLWVARSPLSLTVRFRQLNQDLVFKYSLSNESLVVNGVLRLYSHVFAMGHVNKELVNLLAEDITKLGHHAFKDLSDGTRKPPALLPLAAGPDTPLVSYVPFQSRGFSGN